MVILQNEVKEIEIETRANFAYPSYVYEKPEPVGIDPFLYESDPETIERLKGKLPLYEIAKACERKKERRLSLEMPTSTVCKVHLLVKDSKIGGSKYRRIKLAVGHGTDKEHSKTIILQETMMLDEMTEQAIQELFYTHFYREQRVTY
nr:hypothetical protein 44 [Balneolaceae bacterium]